MSQTFRECGDCSLCCQGTLTVKVNEHEVYPKNPCPHVTCDGCGIFNDPSRPDVCKGYYCAWTQDKRFPDWLKPNKCHFVMTYNLDTMVITGDPDHPIDASAFLWVLNYCALYNKKVHYTIKSASHSDSYDRGTIRVSSTQMKTGTIEQIYEPRELFN